MNSNITELLRSSAKVLITGTNGNLGKELIKQFPDALHPDEKELVITDVSKVISYLEKHKPDAIIHAAAMTNALECERNKERAWKVNVEGTENLLNAAKMVNNNIYFLYVSTAGVFSGEEGNYDESAVPNPSNFYCFTKYIAEERIRNYPNVCIARTNFVPKIAWPYEKAFTDRYSNYLFAHVVAKAIKEVIEKGAIGILHICGNKRMSMFELAKITTPNVKPMTLKDYDGPKLPKDLTLKSTKWKTYDINEN